MSFKTELVLDKKLGIVPVRELKQMINTVLNFRKKE